MDILEAVAAGRFREIAIAREVGDNVLYHSLSEFAIHNGVWGRWADRPVLVQVKQPASRGPLGHPQIRRSGTKQVSEFKPNRKPAHAETYKGYAPVAERSLARHDPRLPRPRGC